MDIARRGLKVKVMGVWYVIVEASGSGGVQRACMGVVTRSV